MPLSQQQIGQLANEIDGEWDSQRLILFGDSLGINVRNMGPVSVKELAYRLILELCRPIPPRDREMLEELQRAGNARLRRVADDFLKPGFFPPGDPRKASMLGRRAFIARDTLRQSLEDFTAPDRYTTHVLIVRGDEPGGRSYTWQFLYHLASNVAGMQATRLNLKGTSFTPREFLCQASALLGIGDNSALPELSDDPQLARTSPLLNSFKGRFGEIKQPYWLVIDDLDEPSVTPAVRETAYALAFVVEELKPPNLWVALLGYKPEIVDPELNYVAQDEARFPDAASVASFFESIAKASGASMSSERAGEIANVMFSEFPVLNKEAMTKLTPKFERMGESIKSGRLP